MQVADDSNLDQLSVDRAATLYQTADNKSVSILYRVGPSDAETQITIPGITTPYFLAVLSDYPVRVRLNGNSATQFTLVSNGAQATNVGAPLPDQCVFMMTGLVTSIYLQPIASAAQTANVKIILTGDPVSAYV